MAEAGTNGRAPRYRVGVKLPDTPENIKKAFYILVRSAFPNLKEGQFRLGGHIEWIRFHKRARREDPRYLTGQEKKLPKKGEGGGKSSRAPEKPRARAEREHPNSDSKALNPFVFY